MQLEEPLNPVLGDGGALSHALMNLCVNAVDAMPGKGLLLLRTNNLPDGRVQLRVKDTGTGMTEAVLAKAVEPFYTTKPVGKGTGLGLAMVFGTMQAHGGDLDIQSHPGLGTEVTLTFPVPDSAAAAALAGNPVDEPLAHGGPLNILVVDDDELIRESLVPMLEILGHTARAAPGGMEALALFQEGLEVDLVILDMNMPGINGAETLARLKALRPGQVVLMSSGFNDAEVTGLVSGHPGVHCIQKPFSMKELRLKLESIK
jgi:CheY-like chemotaxis protein